VIHWTFDIFFRWASCNGVYVVCIRIYVCMNTYIYMFVCTYICTYRERERVEDDAMIHGTFDNGLPATVCTYVPKRKYPCIRIHIYIYIHVHIYIYMYMYF